MLRRLVLLASLIFIASATAQTAMNPVLYSVEVAGPTSGIEPGTVAPFQVTLTRSCPAENIRYPAESVEVDFRSDSRDIRVAGELYIALPEQNCLNEGEVRATKEYQIAVAADSNATLATVEVQFNPEYQGFPYAVSESQGTAFFVSIEPQAEDDADAPLASTPSSRDSPGLNALAILAGLGALAVVFKRRQGS